MRKGVVIYSVVAGSGSGINDFMSAVASITEGIIIIRKRNEYDIYLLLYL